MRSNEGPGLSRRAFLYAGGAAGAAILAHGVRTFPHAFAGPAGTLALDSVGRTWLEAREIVRSGALGPVAWAQGRYVPALAGRPTHDAWAQRLLPLLLALDASDLPSRVTAVGHGAPTVLIEYPSGAVVFLAPGTTALASELGVIRGQAARLSVGDDGLRLRREAPRGVERQLRSDASRPTADSPGVTRHRGQARSVREGAPERWSVDLERHVQVVVAMAAHSVRSQRAVASSHAVQTLDAGRA
jgi:hypothetical protein